MLKKNSAAVLVSTHHIDDVEVLSDRVWFLNERYLAFNGPLENLTELESSRSFNTPTPSQDDITRIAHPVLPITLSRALSPPSTSTPTATATGTSTATSHQKTSTEATHTAGQPLSNTSPHTHLHSDHIQQSHHNLSQISLVPVPPDLSMLVELQFFTWSESVMRKFREEFSPVIADAWLMDR